MVKSCKPQNHRESQLLVSEEQSLPLQAWSQAGSVKLCE